MHYGGKYRVNEDFMGVQRASKGYNCLKCSKRDELIIKLRNE